MEKLEFEPFHINASTSDFLGNNGFGRYIFLPGSTGRAKKIASQFSDLEVKKHPRGHHLYKGTLTLHGQNIDVGAISSGMGGPSLDIIVNELYQLGARRILRVGTSGSLQSNHVKVGALVIPTSCVRDESTSLSYMPLEVPATPSYAMLTAINHATKALKLPNDIFFGVAHSKDSLYAREFHQGPRKEENKRYIELLTNNGVLASDMECAQLFTLGMVFTQELLNESNYTDSTGFHTGAILSVIGDKTPFSDSSFVDETIHHSIALAVETFYQLYLLDNPKRL